MNNRLFSAAALVAFLACGLLTSISHAHFVWVYGEDGKIMVVFGEGTYPDQAEFLGGIAGMSAYGMKDGQRVELEFARIEDGDEGWFEIDQVDAGHVIDIACPYGVFSRGPSAMFLDYSARYIDMREVPSPGHASELGLDLLPVMVDGRLTIQAIFDGQPAKGIEILVEEFPDEELETTTDESGAANLFSSGRYIIRGKHVVAESGEHEGQAYDEKRYYCTLVLDVPGSAVLQAQSEEAATTAPEGTEAGASIEQLNTSFDEFPRGMTSFGAAVMGDHIYVMGGKEGRAHSYASSYQNRDVYALNLESGEWETIGECRGLQGLAVVAHGEKLYRIGGLEARNAEGEEHDLHSVADFVEFDPSTGEWRDLPSLPEGRSSFDACVAGDTIYVVGGWTMKGAEEASWCSTALTFDLDNPEAGWTAFEAPFRTRALAVRSLNGQVFAVGGIEEEGGPTSAVHVFDIEGRQWSEMADVPSGRGMKAFGCSAAVVNNELLVSVYDGAIYQLDGENWAHSHQMDDGRFFHQMLPIEGGSFAMVGGAHMDVGKFHEVDVYRLDVADEADASQR
ncbi:MAG: kelch repeat-containing protein [Planctomycetota bacterium]